MSVKDEGGASWVVKAFSLQHRSYKIWVGAMDGSVAKTAVRVVCVGLKWLHTNKPVMLNYCPGEPKKEPPLSWEAGVGSEGAAEEAGS